MNKVNYQRELDKLIKALPAGVVPTLLLHSCCAPCSSYTLEYLSEYFQITVFYFNPNITPYEEFRHRADEQRRLISELYPKHPISFVEGEYDPTLFFTAVRGLEREPEGGARCKVCYRLRLEAAARLAREQHFDFFTTTLTISPLKNAQTLNEIGAELAQIYQVRHLPSDFKKNGGYLRSIELSKEHNLYRQNFCGCVFSKKERE